MTPAKAGPTPGPWAVVGDRETFLRVVQSGTGGLICDIESTFGYAKGDEANARLIAAAPDLLVVAELALAYMLAIEQNDILAEDEQQILDTARAALRKARGE
jgi:hypothetical protein